MGSSDIRERGIFNSDAMSRALAAQQRYDDERAAERRAHQRLYESQFRVRRQRPIGPRPNYRWYVCQRLGIHPDSNFEPRPFYRGTRDSPPPLPEEPEEGTIVRVMPPPTPNNLVPVNAYELWVLDADTLEGSYDCEEVDLTHHIWSTERYDNLWVSVGLILSDDEFQPVS